jgi:hypothetical protein
MIKKKSLQLVMKFESDKFETLRKFTLYYDEMVTVAVFAINTV